MKSIENFIIYIGIPTLLFFFLDLILHYILKEFNISEKSYHLFLIFYGLSLLLLSCICKVTEYLNVKIEKQLNK